MYRSKEWGLVTHVAVCTPNDMHFTICKEAADADRVVLCEKPLTLSDWTCEKLPENVFTVLQLRHSDAVIQLKKENIRPKDVKMIVKVKRDASFWSSWKGQEKRSGGLILAIGIHYIDLLIYLFGDSYIVEKSSYAHRKAEGILHFGDTRVEYLFEILSTSDGQDRRLEFDGRNVSLSKADNLSYEGLHNKVYESLVFDHQGVTAKEAMAGIKLAAELSKNYSCPT